MLTGFGVKLPSGLLYFRAIGFAQNPNAFAFQILLAFCAAIVADSRPKIAPTVLALCLAGLWLTASRAAFIGLPFVVGFALYSRVLPLRRFALALLFAAGIIVFLMVLPTTIDVIHYLAAVITNTAVPKIRPPSAHYNVADQLGAEVSNEEQIATLMGARDIFLAHPIIGGGLGAFVVEWLRTAGKVQVIHSTAAWLLAETGILGFLVILFSFMRIFFAEIKRSRQDPFAVLLVLSLLAMGIVSLFHELFYQRAFWLLFGAAMAMMPRTSEPRQQ